jgi:hypothetical protein
VCYGGDAVTGQHPCKLAEDVLKVIGDADDGTARIALEIAAALLRHRKIAEMEFLSESSSASIQH